MDFALTILGTSGAIPAHNRFPTSQYLQIQNHHFLIDCGEGTQIQLSKFGLTPSKIDHIFISHLHGDHVFGLPGLLFSMALKDRQNPLHIYAPHGLEAMILAQIQPGGQFPYSLLFHEVDTTQSNIIFENTELTVQSIPLLHRIPTTGFLFREKPFERNIIPEKIKEFQLSIPQIKQVKKAENITLENGVHLSNEELTFPPFAPRSFAFVSDTSYCEAIVPIIKEVDLLYHETTYCEDTKDLAAITTHSTAKEAATIAAKAKVGRLITGHYSSRYKEIDVFAEEASSIFPNTVLGEEGKTYHVERTREQP